jgi:hypothetical protein
MDVLQSKDIRKTYIDNFINKNDHYHLYIETMHEFIDDWCYLGYLWDLLKKSEQISEEFCYDFLAKQKSPIYIFCDIHSCEKILLRDYWKYPKEAILKMNYEEFIHIKTQLPEDIYIFNLDYKWTIVLTHEYFEMIKGRNKQQLRYCLFVQK